MSIKHILGLSSGVLGILAFFPYIATILKGRTKPAKASWLIFAGLDVIVLAGMLAKGSANPQMIGVTFGALIVAVLALRNGAKGWNNRDKFCLAGSVAVIAVWLALSNVKLPGNLDAFSVGLGLSLLVGFIGSIPTFVASYETPEFENRLSWTMFWCSSLLATVSVPVWTFAHYAQPVVFLLNHSIIVGFLWTRPRRSAALATEKALSVHE